MAELEQAAEELKEAALNLGARVAGIASVEAVNEFAPPGYRPDDLLPGARSVLMVGAGAPTAGAWKAGSNSILGSIGYDRKAMGSAARRLAHEIEERFGYYSIPIPSARTGHVPAISIKLCAEMAGLGSRSMAGGVILNRAFGLLYFNGVITTMPLPEDGPLEEAVCPHPSCAALFEKKQTTPCLTACPDCLSGEIKDGAIQWMQYRQDCCFPRAQTASVDVFQKLLWEACSEPDTEQRKAILFGSHFTRAVRNLAYGSELSAQCFNCLKRCPVVTGWVRRVAKKHV